MPISYKGNDDKFIWPHSPNGLYWIKLGYHFEKQHLSKYIDNPTTSVMQENKIWRFVWKLPIPQKIKLFLWRTCHNAIFVGENLFKRKIMNSPICPICSQEHETVEHASLFCPWTTPIWYSSQLQFLPTPNNVSRIDMWLVYLFEEISKQIDFSEQRCALIATMLWLIWKDRNAYIFQQKPLKPLDVLNWAALLVTEYVSAI